MCSHRSLSVQAQVSTSVEPVNGQTRLFFILIQLPYSFHHVLDREVEVTRELDVSTVLSLLPTLGPVKEVLIMRYSAHLAGRDLL